MIHSSALVRETPVPAQPLRWLASRTALVNEPTLRLASLATVLAFIAIALLLPPTAAAQSCAWRTVEIGGGSYVPGIVFNNRERVLTVIPTVTSSSPWFNEQQIRETKTATLTAVAITVVQRTDTANGQSFTQTGTF